METGAVLVYNYWAILLSEECMGKTIAIFNQKGGVGKTTTNINLSACLAMRGFRILVADIDPQGNTTSGIGVSKRELRSTLYDALVDESFEAKDAIINTKTAGLDLLPASVDLAGAEVELVSIPGREKRLANVIGQVKDDYDFIFVDCPPSLGLLTVNSLVAADSVLIPVQCEFYALEGVSHLMSTIEMVRRSMNPNLEIEGVLLSMFDGRTNLSLQVVQEVKRYFGAKVYRTVIPRNVRLAEAPSYGLPIVKYDPSSRGSHAYMELAEEFLAREERKNGK